MEIFNDAQRQQVFADMEDWLKKTIFRPVFSGFSFYL